MPNEVKANKETCKSAENARVPGYSLGKQISGCNSPHDWPMSLVMDLAALCDI